VRLWGSAAFIAGSLGAGLLLDFIPARNLIWLVTASLAATAVAAWALEPVERAAAADAASPAFAGSLLRDRSFLAVAAAASLIQGSHAVYYGFSTLEWRSAGIGGGTIGMLWALGVGAEIVLFASSGRLQVAPSTMLLVGAAGAVVRWSAMALDPRTELLPLLQCLHGLSFGATHLGTVGFIARATPADPGATAQGYLAVALGTITAAAMGLSGLLYASWGALAYGAMALMAGVGGLSALAVHRIARG
jgi:PPP family 3-phenylpropionic acid transporter